VIILLTKTRRKYRDEDIKIPSFTFAKNLSILVHSPCFESVFFLFRVRFFKLESNLGFLKDESGLFSSPDPGFYLVGIFFESESGFQSMPYRK
jgi:hypothetical protein